jgi:hypothetical protein
MDSCKLIGYGGAIVGIILLLGSAILRVYPSQQLVTKTPIKKHKSSG